jgi:hypothetical protein
MTFINPVPTTQPPTNRGQRTKKKQFQVWMPSMWQKIWHHNCRLCSHYAQKKKNRVHTAHSKWEHNNGTLINLVPTPWPPPNRGQRTKSNCNRGRCLRGGKNWRHNWRLRSHCAQRNARFECKLERELEQPSLELSRE